jgi:chromosome segregation ATPase
MGILNYLKPENRIALVIVGILGLIFLFWIGKLIFTWFSLVRQRSRVIKCSNIDGLAGELTQILTQEEDEEAGKKKGKKKKGNPGEGEQETLPLIAGAAAFSSFCREKRIEERGIVARHIRAIFEAGLQDSRLDVGELIKHTTNELFRGNSFLKSLLASFIVLGLLGTLIGLADSLAGLSPVLGKGVVERTSADLTSGLSTLFKHLKTAFAPSIWGVTFTVFGVILYSLYLNIACYPLKNMTERLTLMEWVPKLFLTQSQRYLGTLKLGEEQIQKNLEAVNSLIDMQQTIRPDVEELTEKLQTSNQTLGLMNESAREIHGFTISFVDGVTKLSSFQEHLQALYQKMIEDSEGFQKRVQNSIENSQEFQEHANSAFEHQNQQLQESYSKLKAYEDAYIEQRQQIDERIKQVLESAQKTYENLAERNNEVLNAIGGPLSEKLAEIRDSLKSDLNDITRRFDTFDVPIRGAAEKISTTFENFDRRTTTLTNELRSEFTAQQEEINKGLNELFTKITGYADQLSDTNRSLADRSRVLGDGVSALSEKIASLDGSFKAFDQYARSKKDKTEEQIVELTKGLQKEFSKQNEETNKNLEKLFGKFEKYDKQLMDTSRLQAEQAETLRKNLSGLSDSIEVLQKAVQMLEKTYEQRDESLERLKPLGDLARQMGGLVHQLNDSSHAQERQNQAVAKNIDHMAESVRFLAKSIGSMSGKKIPKKYTEGNGTESLPDRATHPFFDTGRSPVWNFLLKLFGKK